MSARGRLVRSPERLALVVPALARLPVGLPASRVRWLEEILLDTRRHTRLVRLGLEEDAVRAEVDLTGAPHALLDGLCRVALDALAWVVARLSRPLSLVLDTGVASVLLDRHPGRAVPAPPRGDDHA